MLSVAKVYMFRLNISLALRLNVDLGDGRQASVIT
jgi:hypothetical protein